MGSTTASKSATNFISFSSDSSLAIIETDSWNPIRILNLTDFTVVDNLTIQDQVMSVNFMDVDNQYILINCNSSDYILDRTTDAL